MFGNFRIIPELAQVIVVDFCLMSFLHYEAIAKLADVVSEGATPRMAGTPHRSGGGITPGRASVRDKLNINPEEALMEEYENGYGAKQQQVMTKQISTFALSKALLTKWACRVCRLMTCLWLYRPRLHSIFSKS